MKRTYSLVYMALHCLHGKLHGSHHRREKGSMEGRMEEGIAAWKPASKIAGMNGIHATP